MFQPMRLLVTMENTALDRVAILTGFVWDVDPLISGTPSFESVDVSVTLGLG